MSFTGASENDHPFEPPGRSMAWRLREHLRRDGFAAAEVDNWRDCGWSIDVSLPQVLLQVALARTTVSQRWMAQVAPLKERGFVSRLLGRPFVSREAEVLALSRSIHRWLLDAGYSAVLWRWDGFPQVGHGTAEPFAADEAAGR